MLDVIYAGILVLILCVPMSIIAVLVKLTSKGPVLHWSDRVGKDNVVFKMPKFRTMKMDAPAVATHLLENPLKYLTLFGGQPDFWKIGTEFIFSVLDITHSCMLYYDP
jgi:O-antigen biosynthesis protein WbqP